MLSGLHALTLAGFVPSPVLDRNGNSADNGTSLELLHHPAVLHGCLDSPYCKAPCQASSNMCVPEPGPVACYS